MTIRDTTSEGVEVLWNDDEKRWETEDGVPCIGDKIRELCPRCNKPRIDINGVEDCDFCMQGLTTSDFIDNACCGHGDDSLAYISLKDGRRFVLDKMNW